MAVSFANPAGFLALLGIPAVLAIHFLQRRTQRLEIATLFLVEELDKESQRGTTWERLRNSALLWLQLLAVLLVTWVLAQPTWLRPESVQQTVLVLDSSVSVRAFLPGLRAALRREVQRLAGAAARSEWTALESDPERGTLYRGGDAGALLAAIDAWQPRSGHHDPAEVLQLARGLIGPRGTVLFVSDRPPAEATPGVEWLTVGHPLDNAGFVGASVEAAPGGVRWRALVVNYSDRPLVRRYHLEAGPVRTTPQEVSIEAGGIASLRGEWPADQARARLVLEPDAFALDDMLPLLVPAPKPIHVAWDAPEGAAPLLERLTDSLDATARGTGPAADLRFHGRPSGGPLPAGSAICFLWSDAEGAPLRKGPIVSDRHPLMAGLNWQGLLATAQPGFAVTNTDTVLLWQQQEPLILLRERGAARQLVFNFDLRRANADRLPALVLLVRRFVESLRADKVAPERANVELNQQLRIAAAPGGGLAWQRGEQAPAALRAGADGEVQVRAPDEPDLFTVRQGDRLLFEGAAGFADVREADFRGASSTNTLAPRTAEIDRLNRRADLLAPLWLALLGIVLLGSWHAAGRP